MTQFVPNSYADFDTDAAGMRVAFRDAGGSHHGLVTYQTSPGGVVELFPEEARTAIAALGGGGAGGPAGPALIVAAADAPAQMKTTAHYVCTGTDDHLVIEQAIADLPTGGGTVQLTPGTFNGHVRVRKANTRLLGSGWGTIIKIQAGAILKNTDCPVRVFADGCYVGHLTVDGNKEAQTHLGTPTSAQVREMDGVAIYANNCLVEYVRGQNCYGHTFIVWNDSFAAEGVTAAARYGNTVQFCWVMNLGLRNSLDFASTESLGAGYDQNINHHNTARGNVLLAGANIVMHTAWDTLVEGNMLLGGGTLRIHTACRRVTIRDNYITGAQDFGALGVSGGLSPEELTVVRRTKDCIVEGNVIRDAAAGAISVYSADGCVVRNNRIINSGGDGAILHRLTTKLSVVGNVIDQSASYGIRQDSTIAESHRSYDLTIRDNEVMGCALASIQTHYVTGLRVLDNVVEGGPRAIEVGTGAQSPVLVGRNRLSNASGDPITFTTANTGGVDVFDNYIVAQAASTACINANTPGARVRRNRCIGAERGVLIGTSATDAVVEDNICSGQSVAAVGGSPQATAIIRRNIGYVSESAGTATIAAAATSVAVSHGQSRMPRVQDIAITPSGSIGAAKTWWVSGIGSTTFTLNLDAAPGADVTFGWSVKRDT